MLVFDLLFPVFSLAGFFLLGVKLLHGHLVTQYTRRLSHTIRPLSGRHLTLTETVFGISFALNLMLFALLCLEIVGFIDRPVSTIYWRLSLAALSLFTIFIIPFLFIKTVVLGGGLVVGRKASFVFMFFGMYLWLFWRSGFYFGALKVEGIFTLDYWCSRIGIVGVAIMAILSGFAAAEKPFYVVFPGGPQHSTSFGHFSASEDQIKEISNELDRKRAILSKLSEEAVLSKFNSPQVGMFHQLYSSFSSSLDNNESEKLIVEINALEAAYAQCVRDVSSQQQQPQYGHQHSFLKQYNLFADNIVAIYCIYKIGSSLFSVLFYRMNSVDPVSFFAGFLLHFLNFHLDTRFWSMQLSLWTIGMLVLSSLSNFLTSLMRFLTLFSPFDSAEASVLIIAYIAAVYSMATILTLKSSLPSANDSMLSVVLPHLKFDMFVDWFDLSFVISASISFVILFLYNSGYR